MELRRVGDPRPDGPEHTEVGASRWSAPRGSPGRASATSSATPRSSRSRSTASRSTAPPAHGHTPMLPPVLVREQAMYGTGFFPTDRSNIYALEADDLYLTGTSEVALAGFHMEEILEELPLRYAPSRPASAASRARRARTRAGCSASTSSTRSSSSASASPRRSGEEHERLLAIEEELVQALGLPYRVVNVAAGDLGDPAAKKYDIEAWFPSQQRYREITSTSNTTDFQARRLGIRYRAGEKRLETPHTLNGTAVTDRWLLALLENFARRGTRRACARSVRRHASKSKEDAWARAWLGRRSYGSTEAMNSTTRLRIVSAIALVVTSCGLAHVRASGCAEGDLPGRRAGPWPLHGQHRLDREAVPLRREHGEHGLGSAAVRLAGDAVRIDAEPRRGDACILSPGTHGFAPGVIFCHSPDNKIYEISADGATMTVFATLPAPYPPAADGALNGTTSGTSATGSWRRRAARARRRRPAEPSTRSTRPGRCRRSAATPEPGARTRT